MSRYTLVTSILNRFTGAGLSVGLLLFVYWLMAVASGGRAYAQAQHVLAHGIFKVLYAALVIAVCYHLVAGIRHLVWDTGHGLERAQSQRSAWLVIAVSLVLIALVGFCLLSARGQGA